MRKYVIIDFVGNDWYYYNDDIDLGFALDRVIDGYQRYNLPLEVTSYNNGKVYVIKMERVIGD